MIPARSVLTFMILGGLAATPLTAQNKDLLEAKERAAAAWSTGDWSKAAAAFRVVVKATPDDGDAWHRLGYSLHALGQLDEALVAHKRAAASEERKALGSYNVACVLALQGKKAAAFEWLHRAAAAGFTRVDHMEQDTDLDSLREDPRFAKFIERVKAGSIKDDAPAEKGTEKRTDKRNDKSDKKPAAHDRAQLSKIMNGLEQGIVALRSLGLEKDAAHLLEIAREVKTKHSGESRSSEGRAGSGRDARANREIEVARKLLAGLRKAHSVLREAGKLDRAELMHRAIRAREVNLEGRRDDEAKLIRKRGPNRETIAASLMAAAELYADRGYETAAKSMHDLARQFAPKRDARESRRRGAAENAPARRLERMQKQIEEMQDAIEQLRRDLRNSRRRG